MRFRLKDPATTSGRLEIISPQPVYQGPPYSGPGLFHFANIACLTRGTVIRIDTNATSISTAIIGQYYSAPASRSRSPSRLAVDFFGNAWVVAREEFGGDMGSVTRIALLIGGTRVDGTGQPSSTGEYLIQPFQYCSVGDWNLLDRNHDGKIDTSYGRGLTLGWDEAQTGGNDVGGVSLAEDELIFSYTRIPGTNSVRGGAVAIDAAGDVITGGYDNGKHQKLSGAFTSAVPGIADYLGSWFIKTCDNSYAYAGGYGALVDFDGVLWGARWGGGGSGRGLRYDPLLPDLATCTQQTYGLGLAPHYRPWRWA